MTIKELIKELKKYDQSLSVTLDTCEGIEILDISQVYNDEKGIVLYGSIFDRDQSRINFNVDLMNKQ